MKTIFLLLIFLISMSLTISKKNDLATLAKQTQNALQCKPFGVRLNWGRSIMDSNSDQIIGIRFNTVQPCLSVNLLINEIYIINCPLRPISQFKLQNGSRYMTYIHQCSLSSQIEYDKYFSYNILQQNTLRTFFQKDITIKIRNPRQQRLTKFIHFSDWAQIKNKFHLIPDITVSINKFLQAGDIDAVIINGDIGYQLNSSPSHHQTFMELLSKISKFVPIIVNRGNHQYQAVSLFFCEYFQSYDLCIKNATSVQLGSAYLAIFDPQAALIPRKFKQYTQTQRLSSLENLIEALKLGKQSGRELIALSHYPMVCSYPSSQHCIPNKNFKEFLPLYVNLQQHFNALIDYRVSLVLSGHIHTYQRTHPLIKGYKYIILGNNNTYTVSEDEQFYLIQVVDGVAGSDNDLFEEYTHQGQMHQVMPFVASFILKTVGFGVLQVEKNKISYEHFGVYLNGSIQSLDKFSLNLSDRVQTRNQQL